jgi:hypothetical protein
LFLNFVYTAVAAVVLGGILVLIRLLYHFQKKANPLQTNFFYVLSGIFNLNIFIIWMVSIWLNILELGSGRLQICAIASLLLAIVILIDLYKTGFKTVT